MAFQCPNCGGNAVFDVKLNQVRCEHCESVFSPELFRVRRESRETKLEDQGLVLFTCAGCGAELQGTEDSVVGFCPYCGGQSMLQRGGTSTKVEYLLPFRISREQCAELYRKNAARVRYLPKELKSSEHLERFTGIYMPYYDYEVEMGQAHITGTKTVERHSRYDVVNTYQIQAQVEGGRCTVPFDASRYLDDELAGRVLPFNMAAKQPFNPSYLSGFYADASTVEPETYYRDAENQASSDMVDEVADQMQAREGITVDKTASRIDARTRGFHSALLPLWFLTWRRDDRVAYAVVNGETGKVVADLPVDMKAFALGCAAIAAVLFAALELLFQPTPILTSVLSLIAAAIMAISVRGSTKRLFEKQTHANDKGWSGGTVTAAGGRTGTRKTAKTKKTGSGIIVLIMAIAFAAYAGVQLAESGMSRALPFVVAALAVIIAGWCAVRVFVWQKDIPEKQPSTAALLVLIAAVLNAAVAVWSPVSDGWYYIGDAVCILILVLASALMTQVYNLGTMRPLPKLFDRNEVGK